MIKKGLQLIGEMMIVMGLFGIIYLVVVAVSR